MKKLCILSFIILISMIVLSCSSPTETVTLPPITKTITTTPQTATAPPKTYEFRMYGTEGEPNGITIPAEVGDRIVARIYAYSLDVKCEIRDEWGNKVQESARITQTSIPAGNTRFEDKYGFYFPPNTYTLTKSIQQYPWNFAFISASGIGYIFVVTYLPPSANTNGEPKVQAQFTVYPK